MFLKFYPLYDYVSNKTTLLYNYLELHAGVSLGNSLVICKRKCKII